MSTLGLDYANKKYITKVDGVEIPVKIWDTAGQERFRTLTYSFYKKADGVIVAFDVTDKKTFQSIRGWIEAINNNAKPGVARVLVGCKIDLSEERTVS